MSDAAGPGGWVKRGRVDLPLRSPLIASHAMLPTPHVREDRIRVYFACCDDTMRGRIFWADLDRTDPHVVLAVSDAPALDLGSADAFDADGVNPSQMVQRGEQLLLYYIGWRRHSEQTPYTLFMGLAASEDGGQRFERVSAHPILAARPGEQLFRTAGHVFHHDGAWRMLYIGGDAFHTSAAGRRLPHYGLRLTSSVDGVDWTGPSQMLLEPDVDRGEIGFGRPVLWRGGGRPELMVSSRTEDGYRLLHANDLTNSSQWAEVLGPPQGAWEEEMTCFGAPCAVGETEHLFYNGNGYGRSGFGFASRPAQPPSDELPPAIKRAVSS